MVRRKSIPTPLVPKPRRRPVRIGPNRRPTRFRGMSVLLGSIRLLLGFLWLRVTRRSSGHEKGRRTREFLDRFGGLWIKVGQLLSLRIDLFSLEFCDELARLQDQALGIPLAEVQRILTRELGRPIDHVFSDFDPTPVAAASMAQVHRARLRREGVWVAIKVQRPYIAETVTMEMRFLDRLIRLFGLLDLMPHMRWQEMITELKQIMAEELDFRFEATNLERMRKSLRGHKVTVPEVFPAYCTQRLLVSEFIDGVLMSDYVHTLRTDPDRVRAWCTQNRVDPVRLGRRLALSLMRQTLEDNLYHGDLHPGNIMLLRGSRAVLIDLGTVGFTDVEFLTRYRVFTRSVGELDFAKAADTLMLLAAQVPVAELEKMRGDLCRLLRDWSMRTQVAGIPYHEKSISSLATSLIRILASYKCTPDWSFLRIRRAEQTLDASLIHLVPDTNYTKLGTHYFRGADRRRFKVMLLGEPALPDRIARSLTEAEKLLHLTTEALVFSAGFVRRNALEFEVTVGKFAVLFESLFSNLRRGTIVLGGLILLKFVYQRWPTPLAFLGGFVTDWLAWIPSIDTVTSGVLLLAAFWYSQLGFRHLRERFAKAERPRGS